MAGFVASASFATNPGFAVNGPSPIETPAPAGAIAATRTPTARATPAPNAPVFVRVRICPPGPRLRTGWPVTPTDGRLGRAGDTLVLFFSNPMNRHLRE